MASFLSFSAVQFLIACTMQEQRIKLFYHVNDVNVYLGRQMWGRVPDRRNELEAFSCSFCPKCFSFERSQSVKKQGIYTTPCSRQRTLA